MITAFKLPSVNTEALCFPPPFKTQKLFSGLSITKSLAVMFVVFVKWLPEPDASAIVLFGWSVPEPYGSVLELPEVFKSDSLKSILNPPVPK